MTLVVLLDDLPTGADSQQPTSQQISAPEERGRLPVAGLIAVATSGAFAVWTSLTCFVC